MPEITIELRKDDYDLLLNHCNNQLIDVLDYVKSVLLDHLEYFSNDPEDMED